MAEGDLGSILEDSSTGFGWDITVTDPDSFSYEMKGYSNDISQIVDPDTGQIVSGRSASVALRISSLILAGFSSIPVGVIDSYSKPWLIEFNDINSNSYTFKVIQSNPDRSIGMVTCLLEAWL